MSDQRSTALAILAGTLVASGCTFTGIGASEAVQAHDWRNIWFVAGLALMALSLLIGLVALAQRKSPDDQDLQPDGQEAPASRSSPGHKFCSRSPNELTAIFATHNHIQALKIIKPYLGQWLRVQGEVDDVDPRGLVGARLFLSHAADQPFFDLIFSNRQPLSVLKKGTPVVAVGRIHTVTSTRVSLRNCQLELVGGGAEPSKSATASGSLPSGHIAIRAGSMVNTGTISADKSIDVETAGGVTNTGEVRAGATPKRRTPLPMPAEPQPKDLSGHSPQTNIVAAWQSSIASWAHLGRAVVVLGDPAVEVWLLGRLVLGVGGHSEPAAGDLPQPWASCSGVVGASRRLVENPELKSRPPR